MSPALHRQEQHVITMLASTYCKSSFLALRLAARQDTFVAVRIQILPILSSASGLLWKQQDLPADEKTHEGASQ